MKSYLMVPWRAVRYAISTRSRCNRTHILSHPCRSQTNPIHRKLQQYPRRPDCCHLCKLGYHRFKELYPHDNDSLLGFWLSIHQKNQKSYTKKVALIRKLHAACSTRSKDSPSHRPRTTEGVSTAHPAARLINGGIDPMPVRSHSHNHSVMILFYVAPSSARSRLLPKYKNHLVLFFNMNRIQYHQ